METVVFNFNRATKEKPAVHTHRACGVVEIMIISAYKKVRPAVEKEDKMRKKRHTLLHLSHLAVTNMPPEDNMQLFLTLGSARRNEDFFSQTCNILDPLVVTTTSETAQY